MKALPWGFSIFGNNLETIFLYVDAVFQKPYQQITTVNNSNKSC